LTVPPIRKRTLPKKLIHQLNQMMLLKPNSWSHRKFALSPNLRQYTGKPTVQHRGQNSVGGSISTGGVLLSSRNFIEGKIVVEEFGLVTGCAVHARTFWHDLLSRVIGFFGGEVPSYSELVRRSTQDSAATMMKAAVEQGANCVLAVRYNISATSDPTAGVFCYSCAIGTAVRVIDEETKTPVAKSSFF